MKRITAASVNAMLRSKGVRERLTAGRRYFYFYGGDSRKWYSSSVMVSKASDLTLEQWWEEYESLRSQTR